MSYAEFREAMKNEEMRKELAAYLEEKKPEAKEDEVRIIVEFAAARGYTVTAEELGIERAKVRELTDDEMEHAAGGCVCWENSGCLFVDRNLVWDIF